MRPLKNVSFSMASIFYEVKLFSVGVVLFIETNDCVGMRL